MNRHFINYLPDVEPLGAPIRKEPEPVEPTWQPASTPGYETRTVNGRQELRAKPETLVTPPFPVIAPLVTPIWETLAEIGKSIPAERQKGAPPESGWYEVEDGWVCYFDGSYWSRATKAERSLAAKSEARNDRSSIQDPAWRGARLTGNSWPEPA